MSCTCVSRDVLYMINASALLHSPQGSEPCTACVSTKYIAQYYRRIFVYTFRLINICLSLSDGANKIKTLNIERA